ncbi:conjugal transfer protein TraG [Chryseobacterium phosphatilyticum]|uniref:Conjugal transfer protein TraG n=1 Tax=Chryseobacterium phosphatilyticum TaxID=475075 RepID=A0A316WLX4_9FLAO|nr:TraM recognition domain-containing protein [Chryseobacterium phosphatilyticum]PWN62424.1 conjugal transfer protein TraG [Chryseobacterium phosphatilyticum]
MAQDKDLGIYTGLFFALSVLLMAIDIIALGNVSLNKMGIDIFTPFANRVLNMGFYSGGKYYLVRFFIVLLIAFAVFGSKPKKNLKENANIPLIILKAAISSVIFIFTYLLYHLGMNIATMSIYTIVSVVTYFLMVTYFGELVTTINSSFGKDRFGKDGRKFQQTQELMENEYSVNLKTDDGWINVVNPFRASLVIGTPGSGKSFAILQPAIEQHIKKGFAMCVYDYKFPTLSVFTYNCLEMYKKNYNVEPEFCVINFDDPRKSHRCNPLQPELLIDSVDAVEAAQVLMIALNRSWNSKQGDFFVESPINYVACLIWALRCAEGGKYCSLPHLIELLSKSYEKQFQFLASIEDGTISNMAAPFISAYENQATDQLEGQIASARLGLSRMTSPVVYWVMTTDKNEEGNEIDGINLKINDPKKPKILCIGNNPEREKIYSVCISLFTTKIMKVINRKYQNKSALVLDELTTMSFPKGTLDNIIATGRSNEIATWLGFQDITQAVRDFSKENAESIVNTMGNIFSGQVSGDTAQRLSRMFGKIKVQKESHSISDSGTSISYSEQLEELIPESEISTLSQGVFCGKIADNFTEKIEQKFFYSTIHVDPAKTKKLESGELPDLTVFLDAQNNPLSDKDINQVLLDNFNQVKADIDQLLERTLTEA